MINIHHSRYKKAPFYAIYWLSYVLLFGFIQAGPDHDYRNAFGSEIISLPLKIVFVLIIAEYLMEHFLFRKKIWAFVLWYIPLLLLFAFFQRLLDNYIILEYFLTYWQKEALLSIAPYLYNIIKLQFVITIPFSVKLFYNWASEQNKAIVIAEEKTQAELNLLRNQFHPHFIFNVLNSLYSKILLNSPESAEIVTRISSLLRFSIYDINTKMISLEKEVRYLTDYISLQKIRFDEQLEISFNVEGVTAGKYIEPFIIMPFVENSFKYCMNIRDGQSWITMHMSVQQDWLTAKIENSFSRELAPPMGEQLEHGVGLDNVKKRLDLLYPGKHTLKITDSEDSFFVHLKIKLEDHA